MSGVLDVLTAVLLLTASSLTLLAAIGLQRFDSVFARIHPATKAITLGVVSVAVGAAFQATTTEDAVKLLLVAVLQLVTSPIASHMIARAAYRAGTEVSERMQVDELATSEAGQRGAVVRPRSSRPDRQPGPDRLGQDRTRHIVSPPGLPRPDDDRDDRGDRDDR